MSESILKDVSPQQLLFVEEPRRLPCRLLSSPPESLTLGRRLSSGPELRRLLSEPVEQRWRPAAPLSTCSRSGRRRGREPSECFLDGFSADVFRRPPQESVRR